LILSKIADLIEIEINSTTHLPEKSYVCKVYPDITVGEFIRNSCVNIGIDPDTIDGTTRNVKVYLNGSKDPWKYNPYMAICKTPLSKFKSLIIDMLSYSDSS
jgi:hypothetical protein